MAEVLQAVKIATKAAKTSMVLSLCNQLDREQKNNNGNIPHGLIFKMVLDANAAGMKINRHDIANYGQNLIEKREQMRQLRSTKLRLRKLRLRKLRLRRFPLGCTIRTYRNFARRGSDQREQQRP